MFYHNPDSWKQLWRATLAKVAGDNFVRDHMRVEAEVVVNVFSLIRFCVISDATLQPILDSFRGHARPFLDCTVYLNSLACFFICVIFTTSLVQF